MPVPSGEKVTTSLEESLLQALDAKFAEQEKVIRELLSGNGVRRPPPMEPWSFVSEPPSMPVFHHASEQSEAPKNKVPSGRTVKALGAKVMSEKWKPDPPLKACVKGNLDMLIAGVVVINVIMMIIHSQWAFDVIEYIFFSIYCSDMLVRMIVLRKEWYFDPKVGVMYMNIFDAFLVLLNFTELFMIPLIDPEGTDLNTNHIRLIKFTRVARTLRIVRGLSILRQLRALIATCIASLGALFWSLILLLLMKVMFALVISQAIQLYVMSDADYDVRILMNSWYGSFLRAMYTMFEITYSGGWPLLVRPVIEMVSPWYSIPFLLYVVFVVFAAIRIVTALFLKETLSTAANDAELVIEDSRRTAVQYQKKLEELFRLVDDDGDGNLTPEEFVEAMSLPSVDLYLRYLEITIRDCGPLFDILSGEDGLITISEFCQGIMQLKGNARALDMVVLQHENAKLMKESCKGIALARVLGQFLQVCPDDPPWTAAPPDWLEQQALDVEKLIRELLSGVGGQRRPPPMEPLSFVSEPPSWTMFQDTSDTLAQADAAEAPKKKPSVQALKALGAKVMSEKWEPDPPLKAFVKGNLDMLIGVVVLINVIMMIIHSQWVAWKSEVELNLIEPSDSMFSPQTFDVIEYIFFSIYCSDMLVRMIVLRKEWYFDPQVGTMYLNIFDAFLVIVNFIELFVIPLMDPEGTDVNTNHIRLIKFTRVARTLRMVRSLSILRQLRALMTTIVASLGALFWSLVFLLLMKVMFALVISQAMQVYVMSDADFDVRILMNSRYGSFLRAMYTMFEITYSGGWPLLVRPVVDLVSPWYSIPFLLYVVFVVFAAVRIVTALFIKETLSTAANDAELVIEDSRRKALEYQKKLEELFHLVDDDGDGNLTPEEFVAAMSLPSVDLYLRYLEITIRDCGPLFDILSGEDGLITISEFCQGIMQLKGNARALDMVVLQHENAKLMKECMRIRKYLEKGWNRTYSQ
ncbi:Sodium channel protein type 11 subunit alpha (NaN) (Sensory neuron sodium channel 2) (Sodium channel protein type XI subunit alpha) (Voltage-gated sodium channel subunit alpha Nav1.9) [Durusdinium trenchii]|uniref:Sodium channel protein type 11 subunit alpha (NaN) (Sensory neuron sodium channel 2) (Sodium channel protein type XI subunit alpha) (Voltage-gated sodium channel subunit alpha Nav1.9) n=1 Tax=Durusdinium trenchii TaxID=1381693 RepID=A0ABP0KBN3_9DINO